MEFTVTTTVYIDIDGIIEQYNLNADTLIDVIKGAVDDYVSGMDDCDFYLIDSDIKKQAVNEIIKRIGSQMSLFD